MAKKLPKRIYVKWNIDTDEPFLQAATDPTLLCDLHETSQVGGYELKTEQTVINETRVE